MVSTYGLGDLLDDKSYWRRWRDKKGKPKEEPKICRICGKEWIPRTPVARGRRDICYKPECEKAREAERRERRKARRRLDRES